MPVRSAKAQWSGDLLSGNGTMSLGSGAFQGPYSFRSRMEEGDGTNPEELIAAAHSGCFSMALAASLTKAGFAPTSVRTDAKVAFDKVEAGFAITRIDLITRAAVPGIDDSKFQEIAAGAKQNCPVSKALSAIPITLDAKLES